MSNDPPKRDAPSSRGPKRSPSSGLADRLRFGLELFVLRSLGHRLLLAAAIVAAIAVLGGLAAYLLAGGFEETGDAVWWAFLRLTDPGYLGDDEGTALRGVSTVVTVLGYVLFLGLLIAILTQWLNQRIARLEAGVTPIALRGHVIVLGWTDRTPGIVAGLLGARKRIQRFLDRHGVRELRVVVMAETVDEPLRRELQERLGSLWDDRRVLLRGGTPLRLDHLERVAFRDAAALILPGADFAERSPEAADAQIVKTLLSVSKHARDAGAKPPSAVAEIFDARGIETARRAYDGTAQVLATDRMVSRLLAQALQQRGLLAVFRELFTVGYGNAIYLRQLPQLADQPFGALRSVLPRAVPIGLMKEGQDAARLHPDPSTRLGAGDALLLIARSYDDCLPEPGAPAAEFESAYGEPRPPPSPKRRLLLLGWSRKAPALLHELAAYGEEAFDVDVVTSTPIEERERQLALYSPERPAIAIAHHVQGYSSPGVLERFEPAGYDQILLLASERLAEEDEADATTVVTCLRLDELLPSGPEAPGVLAELLAEENRGLLPPRDGLSAAVTPNAVSYMVSQAALRPELAPVYDELTRASGPQIALKPAHDLVPADEPVRFRELERAAAARGRLALGVYQPGSSRLSLNPDRDSEWKPGAGLELVCLTSYRDGASGSGS